ncbi:hypothetical protein HG530_010693 [Fusarium avenaceum]|nr:hypothetical protein HG530_010693 [Fusarium avenaceum]
MASLTLSQMPPEIILDISDCLTSVDIKSLSLVDKTIRQYVVPQLFKHVKVHCPFPRDHVLHSVVAKYGKCVSSLSLQVTFYPNPPNSSYDGTKVDATCAKEGWYWDAYPQSVWARNADDVPAMHGLIGLPNCTSLTISAHGEDDFASPDEVDFDSLSEDDFDSPVVRTEGEFPYKRFYFFTEPETYDQVRRAEGKYAWRQAHAEMWRDVARYSQVERLELPNFLPCQASSWLEPEWAEFLGRLKELSVQSFESLEEFLGEHSPSLESLRLDSCPTVGCYDRSPGYPRDPNWGGFWKTVRKGCPMLREVIYEHSDNGELGDEGIADEDDSSFVWPYDDMEDPYGSVSNCLEVNEEELALANGYQEYRLLMEELARRQQSSLHQSLP